MSAWLLCPASGVLFPYVVIGRQPYPVRCKKSPLIESNIDTTTPVFRPAGNTQLDSIESIGLFAEKPQAKILFVNESYQSICTETRQFFRDPALSVGISLNLQELSHNSDFPAFVRIPDGNGGIRKQIHLREEWWEGRTTCVFCNPCYNGPGHSAWRSSQEVVGRRDFSCLGRE